MGTFKISFINGRGIDMDVSLNRSHDDVDHGYLQNFKSKNTRGFTLIQLMTVIAIIAVTLGVGIPSVSAMVQINRMATAMNSLSASFALARSEAVTRNQEIIICKSRDGVFCTRKGGWEQGWIIFEDSNSDESRDKEEKRFWVQDTLPPGIKIGFSAFHSKHHVHYWATGFAEMNGTFIFCQQNSSELTKAMILNKIGRLRKSKTMYDGSPLECE